VLSRRFGPGAALLLVAVLVASPSGDAKSTQSPRIDLAALGGLIAYSGSGDIWVARPDGSQRHRVTHRAGPEDQPDWSPDGKRIAFRDAHRGLNVNDRIAVVNADGSARRDLGREGENEWAPAWSPSGEVIAYFSSPFLYTMKPDGAGRRRVGAIRGDSPTWSPTGKRVAFTMLEPGLAFHPQNPDFDIFVSNRDGTRRRQLTTRRGQDIMPSWSPDGRWIAYTTGFTPANFELWLMRPDGSRKHRIAAGSSPTWSPDSRYIVIDRDDQFYVIRADGSGLTKLPFSGFDPDWTR
jgi:TolB protein